MMKRYKQGWVMEITHTLDECIARIKRARLEKFAVSIAFLVSICSSDLRQHLSSPVEETHGHTRLFHVSPQAVADYFPHRVCLFRAMLLIFGSD